MGPCFRRDDGWINSSSPRAVLSTRHCEEQSDEAIQSFCRSMDCFAALAMTISK